MAPCAEPAVQAVSLQEDDWRRAGSEISLGAVKPWNGVAAKLETSAFTHPWVEQDVRMESPAVGLHSPALCWENDSAEP